jgi:hypothetical protein
MAEQQPSRKRTIVRPLAECLGASLAKQDWYAFCRAYLSTAPALRKRISRQTLAHYRRVSRLPPDIGLGLDHLGAPIRVIRWIAWASTATERDRRLAVSLAVREQALRWPNESELLDAEQRDTIVPTMGARAASV